MSYEVLTLPEFDKEAKRLSKKFPSFRNDLAALNNELSSNPFTGTPIGNNCYKIRLAIKSKGKGKSGGARVITNLIVIEKEVFLLSLYDKSEQENIGEKELKRLLSQIP